MKPVFAVGALIAIIIGILAALGVFKGASAPVTGPVVNATTTDFARIGNLSFDAPGNRQDTPYLVYEEPGKPALKAELVLDEYSICATQTGSLTCMAMSAQYSVAFGGARALVEGRMLPDGRILVIKMYVYGEGQAQLTIDPGRSFIPWRTAYELIQRCEVTGIMQNHMLDVVLTLKDGREVVAVEPVIDELSHVPMENCPALQSIATE